MTSGAGRTVTWTSFNMAASFPGVLALTYDPEHARVRQCIPDCSNSTNNTTYLNDGITGAMAERYWVQGAGTTWRTYIKADGKLVAERIVDPDSTVHMRYFVLDHLGSISVITDENGAVLNDGLGNETGRLSYDPWGRMRNLDGTADTSCLLPAQSATTRGYTSQEEMPTVCLINYNARIYDPEIGRFISADSVVQDSYDPQDLNRYSYVGNNPLAFTDPSGNCHGFFACVFAIATFGIFEPLAELILRAVPILGDLFVIAAGIACGPLGPICSAVAAAGVQGAEGGKTDAVLKAFVYTLAEAEAFNASGDLIQGMHLAGAELTATQAVVHGAIGGTFSVLEGGNFQSGFLAAGLSALAPSPVSGQSWGQTVEGTMVAGALGGLGSVLGGGKFENGAVTGAFAYLFNACAHAGCFSPARPQLWIGYEKLGSVGGQDYYHTFDELVLGDNFYIVRGGPGGDPGGFGELLGAAEDDFASQSSGNGFGDILVDVGARAEALEASGTGAVKWEYVGSVDMSWDQSISALQSFANSVNAAQIPYWPLTQNSNSVAFQAPTALGLPRPVPLAGTWVPANSTQLPMGH